VYGEVLAGNDFPLDLGLVDRIEIIRGPGSALYGSNAVFGVINVITSEGAEREGLQGEVRGGDYGGPGQAGLTYGTPAAAAAQVLASGSALALRGQDYHFREFATGPANGSASGQDGEKTERLFGRMRRGGFALQGLWSERSKEVPTASYGTIFD